jgi:adenylosuccinate synthase
MCTRKGLAVLGTGYGDEGKGSVVDLLSHIYHADVVRFNGASQAAHHIVTPEGIWHCCSQMGAGSFNHRKTHLYKNMIIDLETLSVEYDIFAEKMRRMGFDIPIGPFIHPECRLITRYHKLAGRASAIFEGRSTTGMGVGMVAYEKSWPTQIKFRETKIYNNTLEDKLKDLREWALFFISDLVGQNSQNRDRLEEIFTTVKEETLRIATQRILRFKSRENIAWNHWDLSEMGPLLILEGSQGALLDRHKGFYPHVSPTESQIKQDVIKDLNLETITKIGVLRSYMTRHGRGPLVTEDTSLNTLPELHNTNENPERQGKFRRGWLDLVAMKHGITICGGVDGLFITNIDKTDVLPSLKVCTEYQDPEVSNFLRWPPSHIKRREEFTHTLLNMSSVDYKVLSNSSELVDLVEQQLELPVWGTSYGPSWPDKDLRESFPGFSK